MITLSQREWASIYRKLKEDWAHKPSIFLIRNVMKRELGFNTRTHQTWDEQRGYTTTMYLDFYDEQMEILFRLKYL